VTVTDNPSGGRKSNILYCLDKIRFIYGAVTKDSMIKRTLKDTEVCFHLAAVVGAVDQSTRKANMLKAMRKLG